MEHIKTIIARKRKQLEAKRRREQFIKSKLENLTDKTLLDRMSN